MRKRRQCKRKAKGQSKPNQHLERISTKVYPSARRYLCSEVEGIQVLFPEKPSEHPQLSWILPLSESGKNLNEPSVENRISLRF